MNEFPTPGWPFADLPAASMLQPVRPIARLFSSYPQRTRRSEPPSLPPALEQRTTAGLDVTWARHQDEVREAQRLRHSIFALEMGARLIEPVPGHDIDHFDDFCEHLLVRDRASGNVVGTYRLLTPTQAARAGGLYTDAEFDLTPPKDQMQPHLPLPLPIDQLDDGLAVEPPALIKGYLRPGGKVLGPPAWDPDFTPPMYR